VPEPDFASRRAIIGWVAPQMVFFGKNFPQNTINKNPLKHYQILVLLLLVNTILIIYSQDGALEATNTLSGFFGVLAAKSCHQNSTARENHRLSRPLARKRCDD
jgi:hypothetical protein